MHINKFLPEDELQEIAESFSIILHDKVQYDVFKFFQQPLAVFDSCSRHTSHCRSYRYLTFHI